MTPGEITGGPFHDGTRHGHRHPEGQGPAAGEPPHAHLHGHLAAGVTHSHPHAHGVPDLAVAELAARLGPRRPAPLPRREPGRALAQVRELFPASPEAAGAALAGFRAAYPRAPRREGP